MSVSLRIDLGIWHKGVRWNILHVGADNPMADSHTLIPPLPTHYIPAQCLCHCDAMPTAAGRAVLFLCMVWLSLPRSVVLAFLDGLALIRPQ